MSLKIQINNENVQIAKYKTKEMSLRFGVDTVAMVAGSEPVVGTTWDAGFDIFQLMFRRMVIRRMVIFDNRRRAINVSSVLGI